MGSNSDDEDEDLAAEVMRRNCEAQQNQDLVDLLRHRTTLRAAAKRGTAGSYNELHTPTPAPRSSTGRFFNGLPTIPTLRPGLQSNRPSRVSWGATVYCDQPISEHAEFISVIPTEKAGE